MSHGYYKNKTVSTNEDVVSGFDQIPVHRPLFIYFEFEGLGPTFPIGSSLEVRMLRPI